MHKKLVPRKGLQKEQKNEVVKWNFLQHTLHLNDLIRPIVCRSRIWSNQKSKYDYEEKKTINDTTIVL